MAEPKITKQEAQRILNEAERVGSVAALAESLVVLYNKIDLERAAAARVQSVGRDLLTIKNVFKECLRRREAGWIAVMDTSSGRSLEEVYGFTTPHWCRTNPYGGPITNMAEPMTDDEINFVKEARNV